MRRGNPAPLKAAQAPKRVEVSVLKPADLKRLEAGFRRAEQAFDRMKTEVEARLVAGDKSLREAAQWIASVGAVVHASQLAGAFNRPQPSTPAVPASATAPSGAGRPAFTRTAKPAPPPPRAAGNGGGSVSGPEQKILDALAELEAFGITMPPRPQLGVWCGYTNPRSRGFTEPLGLLKEALLVDYPVHLDLVAERDGPSMVALTDAGRAMANPPATPTTTAALQQRILERLDGPERKILEAVIKVAPHTIARAYLGESIGYKNPRSGGFTEPLGKLKTLGLVSYPSTGAVRASGFLFVEGDGA